MKNVNIIQCGIKDLEILQRLILQCLKDAYEPVAKDPVHFKTFLDDSSDRKRLTSELENENSTFFFIKKNDVLAGFIKMNIGDAQTEIMSETYLELERIYLLKDFYRQGLGNLLIDYTLAFAKSHGKQKVWLGVWEENYKAIAFYKQLGFEVFGSHTFMVGEIAELDLMMERNVETSEQVSK